MFILAEIGPSGMEMVFLATLWGCLLLVWLYALVNCLRRKDLSRNQKIAWTLVILFTNYVGLIAYFIASNNRERRLVGRFPKALDPVTGAPDYLGR